MKALKRRASHFARVVALVGAVWLVSFHCLASGPGRVQLALNWKPEPQFGGFYAAEINGHFKAAKLDVDVIPGGAGTPVVQMLATGKYEFGIVSADEVVLARARGADVVALFATYQVNPQGIMVHEGRGFKSIEDVYASSGILAIQKGLPYAMYLERKFKSAKVKLVPYLGGVANFLNDENFSQQCFVTSEPIAATNAGKKVKTFLVADAGYNPYTTVLATNGEYLRKHPELVTAMVEAVRAGWSDYLKDPNSTNLKMQKLNPAMDAKTLLASAKAQEELILPKMNAKSGKAIGPSLGQMTEQRWQELVGQLYELKLIEVQPKVADLYR